MYGLFHVHRFKLYLESEEIATVVSSLLEDVV